MLVARAALVVAAASIALALHASVPSEPHGALSLLDRRGSDHQTEQNSWLGDKSWQVLTNYNDVQYVAYLEVGGQTIAGIVDTGSFELAVFSTVCDTCGKSTLYNPSLSPNHTNGKLMSNQRYGSGGTTSVEAADMVSIGPYAPKLQSFWEVISTTMPVLDRSMFQAIIGLGPPETPVADATVRLKATVHNISSYRKQGLDVPSELLLKEKERVKVLEAAQRRITMLDNFETKMFSVCIGKKPSSDGYLIWNDTAPLLKPEYFMRLPVVGNHTWSVSLQEPQIAYPPTANDRSRDGRSLGCEGGCGALLDSGTSLLAIPGNVISELVMVTLDPGFNCSNMWDLPSIKLKLGGQEIFLPPDTFISEVADDNVPAYLQSFVRLRRLRSMHNGSSRQRPGGRCDFMVMESTAMTANGPLWILGVPFFRQYYTTFEVSGRSNENRAVHLAKASDTCHPASPDEHLKFPPRTQLGKRLIDPTKLWMTPSTYSALSSDYVFL